MGSLSSAAGGGPTGTNSGSAWRTGGAELPPDGTTTGATTGGAGRGRGGGSSTGSGARRGAGGGTQPRAGSTTGTTEGRSSMGSGCEPNRPCSGGEASQNG